MSGILQLYSRKNPQSHENMHIHVEIEHAHDNTLRKFLSKVTMIPKANGCALNQGLSLTECSTTLHGWKSIMEAMSVKST